MVLDRRQVRELSAQLTESQKQNQELLDTLLTERQDRDIERVNQRIQERVSKPSRAPARKKRTCENLLGAILALAVMTVLLILGMEYQLISTGAATIGILLLLMAISALGGAVWERTSR